MEILQEMMVLEHMSHYLMDKIRDEEEDIRTWPPHT